MANPNNCDTCEYKQMKEVGQKPDQFCYMFQDAPEEQCMQHTGYKEEEAKLMSSLAMFCSFADRGQLQDSARLVRHVMTGVTEGIHPVRGK